MKKMLLIIIGVVLILLGFGLNNAKKLQEIHIQKKVTINANINKAYNNVAYLKNFPKWSPFLEADPSQKIKVTGNDGTIGAKYHWEGNNGKDLGYQEIKEIQPYKYIKMVCDIQKPFKANPKFEYSFTDNGNSVTVTQDFNLKSSLLDAFFMGIFGAKKDMEQMNARGLELLKLNTEKN